MVPETNGVYGGNGVAGIGNAGVGVCGVRDGIEAIGLETTMKTLISNLAAWVFAETPAVNARKHSLVRWLCFHRGIQ